MKNIGKSIIKNSGAAVTDILLITGGLIIGQYAANTGLPKLFKIGQPGADGQPVGDKRIVAPIMGVAAVILSSSVKDPNLKKIAAGIAASAGLEMVGEYILPVEQKASIGLNGLGAATTSYGWGVSGLGEGSQRLYGPNDLFSGDNDFSGSEDISGNEYLTDYPTENYGRKSIAGYAESML